MPLRTRAVLALMLLAACFTAPDDQSLGATDGGVIGERCVSVLGYDEVVCATLRPTVCNGVQCAAQEVCCQTTGACVAPGAASCPIAPTKWPNGKPCGSNTDCARDEFCVPDSFRLPGSGFEVQRCIGKSGHCQPINNCGYCSAPGSTQCQVCGCNGVTYDSVQTACAAGVHAPHQGPCGGTHAAVFNVSCGTSAQCPGGAQCCGRTGKCFDASEPWRCELQANGSVLNCASHDQCNLGAGGGSGTEGPTSLCAADTCGGPGLCSSRGATRDCSGAVESVCGCDGKTYVNACWARAGGTRVASTGTCP